jgi:isopenicillin N synthase-like dioxygenase
MDTPVLDLTEAHDPSARTVQAWKAAAVDYGCFRVVNHGVPAHVIDACLEAARGFHAQPADWKERYAMPRSLGNKGYVADDFTAVSPGHARVARDYASLDFGPELVSDGSALESILLGPNLWPDRPGFRAAVDGYYMAMNACAAVVAGMFSRICGLPASYLTRTSSQGCSLLRLLYYPRLATDLDELPNGHTDYEWFTLITQTAPGLEILRPDGLSVLVPARAGEFVVLIGDLLEVLSGGRLESTLHWVRSREPDRYSLTYFYGPDFDTTIRPALEGYRPPGTYPELHAGRHLTALRVRHLAHLRAAVAAGSLVLPFELPAVNPLKAAKVGRLQRADREGAR